MGRGELAVSTATLALFALSTASSLLMFGAAVYYGATDEGTGKGAPLYAWAMLIAAMVYCGALLWACALGEWRHYHTRLAHALRTFGMVTGATGVLTFLGLVVCLYYRANVAGLVVPVGSAMAPNLVLMVLCTWEVVANARRVRDRAPEHEDFEL